MVGVRRDDLQLTSPEHIGVHRDHLNLVLNVSLRREGCSPRWTTGLHCSTLGLDQHPRVRAITLGCEFGKGPRERTIQVILAVLRVLPPNISAVVFATRRYCLRQRMPHRSSSRYPAVADPGRKNAIRASENPVQLPPCNAMQCKALFEVPYDSVQTNTSMLVRPRICVWKDLTCDMPQN